MNEPNRKRKNEISYSIILNEEQKLAKKLIEENQLVIITGRAGSGKTLVAALTALDFLQKKMTGAIMISRAAIEVGKTLGHLPGDLSDKFDPYMEAVKDNLYKCTSKEKIDQYVKENRILAVPVQFVRGKTVDDVLIVDESQNLTNHLS